MGDRAVKVRLAAVSGRDPDGDVFGVDIESEEYEFVLHGVLVVVWFIAFRRPRFGGGPELAALPGSSGQPAVLPTLQAHRFFSRKSLRFQCPQP